MIKFVISFLVLVAAVANPALTYAATPPSFPTCTHPKGTVKVSYSNGVHGIPGDMATYTGSDVVYTLTDSSLLQCFCDASGNGIQTKWWKADALSETDKSVFKKLGWIYIANGSLWGLSADPYMAINDPYTCGRNGNVLGDYLNTSTLAKTGGMYYSAGWLFFGILIVLISLKLRSKKA